ncbi:uncharacterized protein LOC143211531 [Lasioglossum baleicum]|uniref:uncharacterized protein LOC143211531 n=1 Tax=Lasioglossum baleicum TaxID=434251 RepID=UPI003FCD632F
MPTLQCASTILTVIGCHRPPSWTSEPMKFLYKVYRIIILMLVLVLTLISILDIIFNVKNQDEFSDNLVLTIPMLITCCKFCSFLARGDNIIVLINTLQQKPYSPENILEKDVETKFDKHNEYVLTAILVLVLMWI